MCFVMMVWGYTDEICGLMECIEVQVLLVDETLLSFGREVLRVLLKETFLEISMGRRNVEEGLIWVKLYLLGSKIPFFLS